MLTPYEMEDIIERFRAWLAQADVDLESLDVSRSGPEIGQTGEDGAAISTSAGLVDLVEAFTALRHEVKLQTKGTRGLQESAAATLDGLDKAIHTFQSIPTAEARAAEEAARPLVDALVDIDEAISRAVAAAVQTEGAQSTDDVAARELAAHVRQLSWWRRAMSRAWNQTVRQSFAAAARAMDRRFESLTSGLKLLAERSKKRLAENEIERIECVGHRVKPEWMTVVGVLEDPSREAETVVEQLRPGYLWQGKVVRCAEVRAVRAS
jgi:molecular chaperone GrpE